MMYSDWFLELIQDLDILHSILMAYMKSRNFVKKFFMFWNTVTIPIGPKNIELEFTTFSR